MIRYACPATPAHRPSTPSRFLTATARMRREALAAAVRQLPAASVLTQAISLGGAAFRRAALAFDRPFLLSPLPCPPVAAHAGSHSKRSEDTEDTTQRWLRGTQKRDHPYEATLHTSRGGWRASCPLSVSSRSSARSVPPRSRRQRRAGRCSARNQFAPSLAAPSPRNSRRTTWPTNLPEPQSLACILSPLVHRAVGGAQVHCRTRRFARATKPLRAPYANCPRWRRAFKRFGPPPVARISGWSIPACPTLCRVDAGDGAYKHPASTCAPYRMPHPLPPPPPSIRPGPPPPCVQVQLLASARALQAGASVAHLGGLLEALAGRPVAGGDYDPGTAALDYIAWQNQLARRVGEAMAETNHVCRLGVNVSGKGGVGGGGGACGYSQQRRPPQQHGGGGYAPLPLSASPSPLPASLSPPVSTLPLCFPLCWKRIASLCPRAFAISPAISLLACSVPRHSRRPSRVSSASLPRRPTLCKRAPITALAFSPPPTAYAQTCRFAALPTPLFRTPSTAPPSSLPPLPLDPSAPRRVLICQTGPKEVAWARGHHHKFPARMMRIETCFVVRADVQAAAGARDLRQYAALGHCVSAAARERTLRAALRTRAAALRDRRAQLEAQVWSPLSHSVRSPCPPLRLPNR